MMRSFHVPKRGPKPATGNGAQASGTQNGRGMCRGKSRISTGKRGFYKTRENEWRDLRRAIAPSPLGRMLQLKQHLSGFRNYQDSFGFPVGEFFLSKAARV